MAHAATAARDPCWKRLPGYPWIDPPFRYQSHNLRRLAANHPLREPVQQSRPARQRLACQLAPDPRSEITGAPGWHRELIRALRPHWKAASDCGFAGSQPPRLTYCDRSTGLARARPTSHPGGPEPPAIRSRAACGHSRRRGWLPAVFHNEGSMPPAFWQTHERVPVLSRRAVVPVPPGRPFPCLGHPSCPTLPAALFHRSVPAPRQPRNG